MYRNFHTIAYVVTFYKEFEYIDLLILLRGENWTIRKKNQFQIINVVEIDSIHKKLWKKMHWNWIIYEF